MNGTNYCASRPLGGEEVVVGSADRAYFEPMEPGSHPKLRDSKLADIIPFPGGPKSQEMIGKANEELAGFVSLCGTLA